MDLNKNTRKFFIQNRHESFFNYRKKKTAEQIHKIFGEVETFYNKFSPSGCSKNFLAVSSDIDREIEKAKSHINFARRLNASTSNSPRKVATRFPGLQTSQVRNATSEIVTKSSPVNTEEALRKENQENSGDMLSKRIRKVNKIISNCKGVQDDISASSADASANFKISRVNYEKLYRRVEKSEEDKDILMRCKEHCKKKIYSDGDYFKISKSFRNGKKIWKLNHINFMKGVDKIVSSFKTFKEDKN